MSIYGTIWHLAFPDDSGVESFGTVVYAQAVPAHIDHDGPGWEFLPPPVAETGEAYNWRAVVLCAPWTTKGSARNGQEYVNPLLVLTGAEYRASTWIDLYERIAALLNAGPPPLDSMEELREANERLRTALAAYADRDNWVDRASFPGRLWDGDGEDEWSVARAALGSEGVRTEQDARSGHVGGPESDEGV